MKQHKVVLVEAPGQQGYMPIAAAYLIAYASQDPLITKSFSFAMTLRHFTDPIEEVFEEITADDFPDIVAFSCQGWSIRRADALTKRLKAINPAVTIVYGGNHVSHQGHAFFAPRPDVDILINGEGEITFYEYLLAYQNGHPSTQMHHVPGLSFRDEAGQIITTEKRPRISELDQIPSPYLTGILDVTPENCTTALLETNRGCPYACSFCYWGGAIGQKLKYFSEERLMQELEFLAKRNIDSIYICDANFGILKRDTILVDYIIHLRQTYGCPRTLHTNWAKNSNERIVSMCAKLNNAGVHSTYTLAMQTTTPEALKLANRSNMKINRIDELSALCRTYGVVPRGELIWGLPGESYEQFLDSYDTVSEYTDALSVYPHYLLPNTEYMSKVDEYKIKMVDGEFDTDYVYCTEHMNMTEADFLQGLKFIISNNLLKVGGVFFRLYPRVAKAVADIRYAEVIEKFGTWVLQTRHPTAKRFKKYYRVPLATHRFSLGEVWQAFAHDREGLVDMWHNYVEDTFHQNLAPSQQAMLRGAFQFDALTYPYFDSAEEEAEAIDGYYVQQATFAYDYLTFKMGGTWNPEPQPNTCQILSPKGLWRYSMDNWYFGLLSYQAKVVRQTENAKTNQERSNLYV